MSTSNWRRHEATDRQNRAQIRVAAAKTNEAPGIAEKENFQHGGSSSSTSQSADATGRRCQHGQEGKIRGHADRAARTSGISREEAQRQCQSVATERREKRRKGNDIGMVDDIVAVPGGQQVHAMLVQLEAAKMTKKTEQDLVLKALAEKDPDTIVTLSATVIELEADTRADVEESIKFAIRMCQDQSSRNYLLCTCVAEMVDCFEICSKV